MMMASLRDPYAAAAVANVGMLAASQLAQLNQLMMQQQQQHAQQLQQPMSPPQQAGPPLALAGAPLGTPPECQSPPISRTYTYKKVTKPLLERKRRARINRCLDELKELMVGALEAEGENVSKLEKADILELTVRHLQRITKPRDVAEDASRFQAGFSQCASEACHFLLGLPGLDAAVGRRLVAHLSQVVNQVGLGVAGLGQGVPLRPASAMTTTSGTYSPPASPDHAHVQDRQLRGYSPPDHPQIAPDLALPGPTDQQDPTADPRAAAGAGRANICSGRDSPGVDGECRVSSSTSSMTWTRAGKRSRSPSRSEGDEDTEDDLDADSDAPVNYTSEALRRQHVDKRPRLEGAATSPSHSPAPSPSGSFVSSSRGSGHPGSGSDDEDKGPMWRPW